MSSILDALKKLEKETSRGEPAPGWPDITRSARSKHRRPGAGVVRAAFFILIAAGLVAGGGLFFFGSRPDEAGPGLEHDPAPPFETRFSRINPDQVPVNHQSQSGPSDPVTEKHQSLPDMPEPVTVLRQPFISPPVIKRKVLPDPVPDDLRTGPESFASPDPDILPKKAPPDPGAVPQTASLKKTQPAPPDLFEFDRVEDPRIDLQAIAWAQGADNSFVVINNKIIREGGSVDGIKVIRIGKDSVAFQEGQKKWQQEFNIR